MLAYIGNYLRLLTVSEEKAEEASTGRAKRLGHSYCNGTPLKALESSAIIDLVHLFLLSMGRAGD